MSRKPEQNSELEPVMLRERKGEEMKLLVPIDLSPASKKFLGNAEAIARALSAKVWLLHVAAPEPDMVGFGLRPKSARDALSSQLHHEHRELQELTDGLRESGLDATALLVQGEPIEKILNEASKLEVDIIVVGSHGRGAMHHLLIGSVSEGVLRKSDRPVLIIPTHERG